MHQEVQVESTQHENRGAQRETQEEGTSRPAVLTWDQHLAQSPEKELGYQQHTHRAKALSGFLP